MGELQLMDDDARCGCSSQEHRSRRESEGGESSRRRSEGGRRRGDDLPTVRLIEQSLAPVEGHVVCHTTTGQ